MWTFLLLLKRGYNEAEPNICNLHHYAKCRRRPFFLQTLPHIWNTLSLLLKKNLLFEENEGKSERPHISFTFSLLLKKIFCSRKTEEKVKDKRSGMSTVSYWETNPKSYINTGPTVEKWMCNIGQLFSHICVAFFWNCTGNIASKRQSEVNLP